MAGITTGWPTSRTYGEAEAYLESLLIHELAHSVGFQHGPAMKEFESQLKEQMSK